LSWPQPNTKNPELLSDFFTYAWPIMMIIVSTFVVTVRVWVKWRIQKNFTSDDYFMIVGYFATLVMFIAMILTLGVFKWNRHVWDAIPYTSQLVEGRKAIWAIGFCNLVANIAVKISILLFVKRMVVRTNKRNIYWSIWAAIWFVALTNGAYLILIWTECTPFEAWWQRSDFYWQATHHFKCWGESAVTFSTGVFSTVQDFIVATIPVLVVWQLQMPIAKKASVIFLFALGYL
jgi:hypothetical protein